MTIPANSQTENLQRARVIVEPSVPQSAAYSILATACVSPPRFAGLQRDDPASRFEDYVGALASVALEPDPRIGPLVVLENSGTDPDALLKAILCRFPNAVAPRSIEIISYLAPERRPGLHYGYSEFKMIDDLIDQSELLGHRLVKITGRYRFPTLARLLDHVPGRLGFFCDSLNLPAMPGRREQRTINASIFLAERAFYDARVRRSYRDMREEYRFTHVENIIFDQLIAEHDPAGPVTLRLPVSCDPVGVGGNGGALGMNTPKRMIRNAARRLFKGLWV